MDKKNVNYKTENSYVNMFKQKTDTNNNFTVNKNKNDKKNKGINFDDLDDWGDSSSNINYQRNNDGTDENDDIKKDNFNQNNKYRNKNFENIQNNIIDNNDNFNNIQSKNQIVENIINQFNNENVIEINKFSDKTENLKEELKFNPVNNISESNFKINNIMPKSNFRINNPTLNPIQEHLNDEFSVNTSYFTNRFGEINNNVDKIDISNINNLMSDYNPIQTNVSHKKLVNFNINSNDNIFPVNNNPIFKHNYDIPVIEENEEEIKINQSQENQEIQNILNKYKNKEDEVIIDDSLDDDSDFSLEIKDDANVTQNQLEDMNKEFKEIKRKIKLNERKEELEKKKEITVNNGLTVSINNKKTLQNLQNIEQIVYKNNTNNLNNKKKRKQSPYLRNTNLKKENEENLNNLIPFHNYDQNINIMNFPHNMQMPVPMQMMYNNNQMTNMNMMPYPFYPPNMIPVGGLLPNYYPFPQNFNNVVEITNNINNLSSPKQINKIDKEIGNSFKLQKSKIKSSVTKLKDEKINMNNSKNDSIRDLSLTDKNKNSSIKNNYKPKSLKEYKDKFNTVNKNKDPAGLGANIGTKEWIVKEEKIKKIKEYSEIIKNQNKMIVNEKKEIPLVDFKTGHFNDNDLKSNEEKLDDSHSFFDKNLEKNISGKNHVPVINNNIINIKSQYNSETIQNKSGYSHIHNIRKLKGNNKINDDILAKDLINKKAKSRPHSLIKINKEETPKINKNKIYTTLHKKVNIDESNNLSRLSSQILNTSNLTGNKSKLENSKLRPLSSKIRLNIKNEKREAKNSENKELEHLLNNHNFFQDKVEKIRNFINKY